MKIISKKYLSSTTNFLIPNMSFNFYEHMEPLLGDIMIVFNKEPTTPKSHFLFAQFLSCQKQKTPTGLFANKNQKIGKGECKWLSEHHSHLVNDGPFENKWNKQIIEKNGIKCALMDFFNKLYFGMEIHQRKVVLLCQDAQNPRNLLSASFLMDWDPRRKTDLSAKRIFGVLVGDDLQVIIEPVVKESGLSNY